MIASQLLRLECNISTDVSDGVLKYLLNHA
jgi:hypothetical protein